MAERILECDLGNSACKWRLREAGITVARGQALVDDGFAGLPGGEIGRVRVATVAAESVFDSFISRLAMMRLTPEVAVSQREIAGVRNGYGEDFARLGVDRWLAIVAAYQFVGGAALVLDAGSALTADLVDDIGDHLGGYIIPGNGLMKSSLLADTGKVRFDPDVQAASLVFGCSTQASVMAGVLAAQIGAAQVAIEQAKRRIPGGFAILVTGGEGPVLLRHLSSPAQWVPELVLDGLSLVLP